MVVETLPFGLVCTLGALSSPAIAAASLLLLSAKGVYRLGALVKKSILPPPKYKSLRDDDWEMIDDSEENSLVTLIEEDWCEI